MMRGKILSSIMVTWLLINNVSAQDNDLSKMLQKIEDIQGKGVIVKGVVKDSALNEILPFAGIGLQSKDDVSKFYSVSTDDSGRFMITEVDAGNYQLNVDYVGYRRLSIPLVLTEDRRMVDLGMIYPVSSSTTLKEVVISDYKRLIQHRPDGLVYDAEKDGTNNGTTADQVLRKVPMVTVDLEGNVQLRGSGNIKVLIDGRPSTILASSVKDALRQIPSENIKSVEVITSPGAKYDAEGAAGVINIITKRNLMKGISGAAYTGLNYRTEQKTMNGYAGTYINYRNKNFGLTANIGGGRWTMESEGSTKRTDQINTGLDQNVLQQNTQVIGNGPFVWSSINADYQIDTFQFVNAGVNFNPGNWKGQTRQTTSFPAQNMSFDRNTNSEAPRSSYAFNAGYTKKFRENSERRLDILSMYSINNNENNYELIQKNNQGVEDYREKNSNQTNNNEFTAQIDYTHPFKKHQQKLETGVKYIRRDVLSDYYLYAKTASSDYVLQPNRSNHLDYIQHVASLYGQYSVSLTERLSLIGGMRYEYTNIDAFLRDGGGKFGNDFDNFLPNAILSYSFPDFSNLSLSYNQRIERPSIDFVNPFVNYSDPLNIQYGNPELEPETTHKIELTYGFMAGSKTNINLGAFYSISMNAIEGVAKVNNGVGETTFGNVAQNQLSGLNLFGSTRLFDRWMFNLNGNLYYKQLKSKVLKIENSGVQYDFNIYTNFRIANGFSAEAFGMYSGNRVSLQGVQSGWYYYNIGVKKTVLKGKGDLTLVAENIFHPHVRMVTDFNYQNAHFYSVNDIYSRGIRLSFNYRFGKMNFAPPQKTIQNDDLKTGESKEQGGGMGGGIGR